MKKYEVIEAAPNRSGWRVVDGEFMVWRDISHHATKEEAEAAKAMYEWYAQWANVMELTVTPCLEDAEAGPILASMAQR